MDPLIISFELVEEGVGFSMSEKKDYEKDFSRINKWAGRWAEYYSAKTRYEELTRRVRQQAVEQKTPAE